MMLRQLFKAPKKAPDENISASTEAVMHIANRLKSVVTERYTIKEQLKKCNSDRSHLENRVREYDNDQTERMLMAYAKDSELDALQKSIPRSVALGAGAGLLTGLGAGYALFRGSRRARGSKTRTRTARESLLNFGRRRKSASRRHKSASRRRRSTRVRRVSTKAPRARRTRGSAGRRRRSTRIH